MIFLSYITAVTLNWSLGVKVIRRPSGKTGKPLDGFHSKKDHNEFSIQRKNLEIDIPPHSGDNIRHLEFLSNSSTGG